MQAIKILLSLSLALFCIFYAIQNVVNLDAARAAFTYVMGGLDHEVYPVSFGPRINHPVLIWAAMATVIGLEFLAGLLALKGSWDMWVARGAGAAAFQAAKRMTNLGAGVGLLAWFGLFQAFGGAYFQQWQTAVGEQSLRHAGMFVAAIGVLILFINLVPDD